MLKEKDLINAARREKKTIVLPEVAFSERTASAAFIIGKKKIANLILIGDDSAMVLRDKRINRFQIINPKTSELTEMLAKSMYKIRKDKGLTLEEAKELILDPYYFGTMLVKEGYADGMVGGAECAAAKILKPALQIIKAKKDGDLVSSCFLVLSKSGVFKNREVILSDCGINENPTGSELVQIANASVRTAQSLGMVPKLAFLSYSTHGSAKGELVDKVKTAVKGFKNSDVVFDGELQFDAAVNESVAKIKCPDSPLKGQANVLVFPNLEAGDMCYKAIKYTSEAVTIGRIVQGLNNPVNCLPRDCSVDDIVVLTAVTVIQCKN